MQFIDLAAQQRKIRTDLEDRIKAVLDHGRYIMGPEVGELEKALGEFVGVEHAVACSSGTDALLMALMAHGVSSGDAVFTTPFTFIATAEVITLLGAVPIFVDIDPETFNMDPSHLRQAVEAVRSGDAPPHPLPAQAGSGLRPRGIIAVDLFGLPADYDEINTAAEKHGLFVVEDAAQSLGAEYRGGKACGLAEIACASFFPAKPLGCYGDGGMCFTRDAELAEIMRSLRLHGKGTDKYDNARIGINGRLDTMQAAILLSKFQLFPQEMELRQEVARRYTEVLSQSSSPVSPPRIPGDCRSVWAQYSVLAKSAEERDALQARLKNAGIPTAIYYPKPLHLQSALSRLGYGEGDFPVSEDCSRRIFSLPMHPYLGAQDQDRILSVLMEG